MYTALREVLKGAELLHMATRAFNTHNLEVLSAITKAAVHQKTPVITQTSCGTVNYVEHRSLVTVCRSIAEEYGVDVVLHLDHARGYDEVRKAIDTGFSSVIFDGSSLPLKENILGTKRVVDYVRARSVSVGVEFGIVGGTEDGIAVSQDDACCTDPKDAVEFVRQTGIDALAVAIGTSHDQYKLKINISFECLRELQGVVNIPLVIHGETGVKNKDVKRVTDLGVRKFNAGTELLVDWSRKSEEYYGKHHENISNRDNAVPYLDTTTEIVEREIHLFKNLDSE